MGKTQTNPCYHYRFKRYLDIDDVQDTLMLAVIGAENLHGRSQVRLDGRWKLDRQRRQCMIDATSIVGRDIARLFTGYLAKEFGEQAFQLTTSTPPERGNGRG